MSSSSFDFHQYSEFQNQMLIEEMNKYGLTQEAAFVIRWYDPDQIEKVFLLKEKNMDSIHIGTCWIQNDSWMQKNEISTKINGLDTMLLQQFAHKKYKEVMFNIYKEHEISEVVLLSCPYYQIDSLTISQLIIVLKPEYYEAYMMNSFKNKEGYQLDSIYELNRHIIF